MTSKDCPSCGERLSSEARRCVCGWSADAGKKPSVTWDHVCQWSYGSLRCQHPVGLFPEGAHKGLCIFHRGQSTGGAAARIAEESQSCTQEQYNNMARKLIYLSYDNLNVAELRKRLKIVPRTNIVEPPPREPGADEEEAA